MINPGQPSPSIKPHNQSAKPTNCERESPFSYPRLPFSCFCPFREPTPTALVKTNNQWMTALAIHNPELKLRDAVVPATHDSGSSTISSQIPLSGSARAQSRSLQGQMQAGARLLDLRYGFEGSTTKVNIYHGPFPGEDFITSLKQIRQFLDENPNEFLVISVINEHVPHSPSGEQIGFLRSSIISIFADIAINGSDVANWFDLDEVTIGRIINGSKKRILILGGYDVSHQPAEPTTVKGVSKREGFGFKCSKIDPHTIIFYRSLNWSSYWVDTDDPDTQLEGVVRNVLEEKNRRGIIVVSQFNLTIQAGNIEDIFDLIFGCHNFRIDRMVRQMLSKKKMLNFLRDQAHLPFNYMWFDFPTYIGQGWEFLIGLNYSNKPLNVQKALLGGTDMTEKVRGFVKRGCCLYIVDFKADFGLADYNFKGIFEIWYEFGSEGVKKAEYGVVAGDWIGSQFVLSYPISLLQGCLGQGVDVSPQ